MLPASTVRAPMWARIVTICTILCVLHTFSYQIQSRCQLNVDRSRRPLCLRAKVGKSVDESKQENAVGRAINDPISIPHSGIVGYVPNNLFYQPVDVSANPLENADDLPGEDGSDEKIAAIQKRIEERVELLKAKGMWDNDENDDYGKNPLANMPLWQVMAMQLKACRPFETWDELALTYTLVVLTTVFLGGYLIFLQWSLEGSVQWYLNTDFTAEYWSGLAHNLLDYVQHFVLEFRTLISTIGAGS